MFRRNLLTASVLLLYSIGAAATAYGEDAVQLPAARTTPVDYLQGVLPILERRCIECHGPDGQESSFRVDRKGALLRGGDQGEPAVVIGKSEQSFLIRVVAGLDDLQMPPSDEPLTADEIAVLRAWIDQGLKMPDEDDEPERLTTSHESFQPLSVIEPSTLLGSVDP